MYKSVANGKSFGYFFHMTDHATLRALDLLVDEALAHGVGSAVSALVLIDGETAYERHAGTVRRWHGPRHPALRPTAPVDHRTRFDLASITKPLVAAALLAELDSRGLDADLTLAEVLPEFRDPGAEAPTIRALLAHTAGFPAERLDRRPDPGAVRFRRDARPTRPSGERHEYSCVGYIWAGLALEALSGRPLADVVGSRILSPVGMSDTGFRPAPDQRGGIAATEWQPGRGLVHGEVHDETSWALGGATGNAGLFGTARDVARFAEALRRPSGERGGLPEGVRRAVVAAVPIPDDPGYRQGLGVRIGEGWCRALGEDAVGHTGFTGTAFATRPDGSRSVVFLTNRVHPTRTSTETAAFRARFTDLAAQLGGS